MTVLSGIASAELSHSLDRCWGVIEDVPRWPEWQRTLERVEVVERDERGRPLICDTVSDAKLTKIHVRVRMAYDPPHRLTWSQVHADDLESLEGSWELEELAGGGTRATYRLAVDPGKIGILARPIERMIRPLVIGHQADELAIRLGESS
jgi:ribosome-associated toxin RatA of RatAB toxin-antitoxin module